MKKLKNLINMIFSRKVIFHLTFWVGLYILFWIIFQGSDINYEFFRKYSYLIRLLPGSFPDLAIISIPLLAIFSTITHYLSDRIFKAWRLWTGIWVIFFIWVVINAINDTESGSGMGVYSAPDPHGFIPTLLLYVIVSIIVILVTRNREKRNK